jgi:uncharacterized protein
MKTVVIAGGTGLVGLRLSHLLREKGCRVRLLSRRPKGEDQFAWNPAKGLLDEQALVGADAVINLAGAGIAEKRWTSARKRDLIDSRVQSGTLLRAAIQKMATPPAVYLSASAIGYYGNSGEKNMSESDAPVDDSFMVRCCRAWEQAAQTADAEQLRTVIFRIGVVLDLGGGALPEIAKPMYFGAAPWFADGRAWWSWIHLDDLCRMFIWALETPEIRGVYNAVAPHPARNADLVRAVRRALGRPALSVPAPAFVLRFVLGEMSAVVLNSNLVSADKILAAGFGFRYPELAPALAAVFSKN